MTVAALWWLSLNTSSLSLGFYFGMLTFGLMMLLDKTGTLQKIRSFQYSGWSREEKGIWREEENIFWYSAGRDLNITELAAYTNWHTFLEVINEKINLIQALLWTWVKVEKQNMNSQSHHLPCLRQIQIILPHRYENTLVTCQDFFLLLQRLNVKYFSTISLYRTCCDCF